MPPGRKPKHLLESSLKRRKTDDAPDQDFSPLVPSVLKKQQSFDLTAKPTIELLLKEKANFNFKNPQWVAEKDALKQGKKRDLQFAQRSKHSRTLKQMTTAEVYSEQLGSYNSIESGYSVKPKRKYCDFLGFETKYRCPKTGLRYYGPQEYAVLSATGYLQLPENVKNELLAIRKANVVLK